MNERNDANFMLSFDLSIIILSYKSKNDLAILLPSVFGSDGVNFVEKDNILQTKMADSIRRYSAEIIIVDNGSNDGTVEWLKKQISEQASKRITLIQNINNGFSAGNNLGIKQSSGKYILLLNPDTKLEPNTLLAMLDFMESRPDVGISGCKLIKVDGKLDLACRRRFPNLVNSFKTLFLGNREDYNYAGIDENISMEVDSVVGAFLLIRKSLINKIGLLDESFFMYGEDLDWCWRCKEAGQKVWYYPKTFITHYKGASSAKAPFLTLKWFHDAMWVFYKKHYSKRYFLFFNWVVFLGIYCRLALLSLINLFKFRPRVSK